MTGKRLLSRSRKRGKEKCTKEKTMNAKNVNGRRSQIPTNRKRNPEEREGRHIWDVTNLSERLRRRRSFLDGRDCNREGSAAAINYRSWRMAHCPPQRVCKIRRARHRFGKRRARKARRANDRPRGFKRTLQHASATQRPNTRRVFGGK